MGDSMLHQASPQLLLAAAQRVGFGGLDGGTHVVFPAPWHVMVAFVEQSITPTAVVAGRLRVTVDHSRAAEMHLFASQWNARRITPTLVVTFDDTGVGLSMRSTLPVGCGISTAQADDFMHTALVTADAAVTDAAGFFPEIASPPEQSARIKNDTALLGEKPPSIAGIATGGHPPPVGGRDTNPGGLPHPVDLPRIGAALSRRQISWTVSGGTGRELIMYRLKALSAAVYLDRGPVVVFATSWRLGGDPNRDFLRVAMCCNTVNEHRLSTRTSVRAGRSHLGVGMEYMVPAAAGLTDGQLDMSLEAANLALVSATGRLRHELTGR
ncbi:YbjN domain-containing protein [Corynebacterium mendelii]|uniref:YbjN domain-containing protein n=1 Tax=Corynebacterium mendelii TaxID=2765362 RepID=A0A939DZC6_9CORY|nr:YbjN domain-containing protein [Corynebacterium mendelii]MBN9643616.1 YbjN domain-containing protein [Corynebacterium mendelii]